MTVFRRFFMAGAVIAALASSPALAQKTSPYESQLKGVQKSMNPSSPNSVNQAKQQADRIKERIEVDMRKATNPQEKAALEAALAIANEILNTNPDPAAQQKGSNQIAVGVDRYISDSEERAAKDGVPDYEKKVYAIYRGITWNDPNSLAAAQAELDAMKADIDGHMANPEGLSPLQKSKIQRASLQVNRLLPELDRRIAYFDKLPEQTNQKPPVQTASATTGDTGGGSIFDKAAKGGKASFGEVDNAVMLGDERTLMLLKSKVGLKNWREAAYIEVLDDLLQESVMAIRQELRKPDVPVERMTDLARALEAVQRLQAPLKAAKDELVKSGAKNATKNMKEEARAHIESVLADIRQQYQREQKYAAANPNVTTDATSSGPVTKPKKAEKPPMPGDAGYYMYMVEHYRHLYGLDGDSSMNGLNPELQMRYLEKFSKNIPRMIENFNQKLAEAEANNDRQLVKELRAALQLLEQTRSEVEQILAMR